MSDDSRIEGAARKGKQTLVSDVTKEKIRLSIKRGSEVGGQMMRNPMGAIGAVILIAFILMGIFGESIAPYEVRIGGSDSRFGALALPTSLGETHSVDLEQGDSVDVEGAFIEKPGWPGPDPAKYWLLRVTTDPEVQSTISVDGYWRNTGSIDWLKMPKITSDHLIRFTDVPGYITPEPVRVLEGTSDDPVEVVGEFVECGKLNVSVEPSLPTTIYVEGFPRGEGGLFTDVAAGTYNISFGAVDGYDVPANQTITVSSGEIVDVVGVFTPNASALGPAPDSYCTLSVVTVPAVPTTVILNSNWTTQWGIDSLKLAPLEKNKTYVVQFTDVPGYVTPDAVILNESYIVPGEAFELVVEVDQCALLEAHTSPSIPATIVVNGIPRNDWNLSVYVPEGTYHVTFRVIDDYATAEPGYVKTFMRVLPLVVFWGTAMIAVWSARLPTNSRTKRFAFIAAATSVALTSGLLAAGIAGEMGMIDVKLPAWSYVVGLSAVTLSIISIGLMQSVIDRNVRQSLLLSLLIPVPYALTMFMDLDQFAMSDMKLLAYMGAAILVALSGFLANKSFKFSVLTFSFAGDKRAEIYAGLVRAARFVGVMSAVGLFLSGMMIYLVQHWMPHWMGTDNFGADIFSGLLLGARTSIIVGVVSAAIASLLGAIVGLYSGYVGGWVDEVIMRLNDIVLSIPWLVLMIIVAAMVGKIDLVGIILIIGLTGWSPTARMVRAQVLSIRERQFVERARAIGAADMGIIRRHVLPNAFPLVFANTVLTVAVSILSEAVLSFLGMRPIGTVTWGTMLSYAQETNAYTIGLVGWIIAPGMCIVLIVLGFSLLGYALDDIMNPKLRKR